MAEREVNALVRASSVPVAIRAWLDHEPKRKQSDLARALGVPRQFLCDIIAARRELPDDRIALLPAGLREVVAEIRARRYEAMAALVRRSVAQARPRSPESEVGEGAAA